MKLAIAFLIQITLFIINLFNKKLSYYSQIFNYYFIIYIF